MRDPTPLAAKLLPLGLILVLAAGCIERAPTPRDRREKFGRSGLSSVILSEAPVPARRVGAIFGESVELVGIDYRPALPKPGDKVEVTYYWRVLDEADVDYKVFVHVDDRGGRSNRINADHWPAGGKYPTGVWRRGEVILDRWSFRVPGYYEGEALNLWTGFYQPGKDERWPVTNRTQVQHDGQNRVLAATIKMAR
jgi:hypothetical protein